MYKLKTQDLMLILLVKYYLHLLSVVIWTCSSKFMASSFVKATAGKSARQLPQTVCNIIFLLFLEISCLLSVIDSKYHSD